MSEDRQRSRHCKRMTDKGARKECDTCFGSGLVAVAPHATVERLHKGRLSRYHSTRHSAGYNLPVSDKIRSDAKQCLSSALMNTKPGNYFVKDECCSGDFGEASQLL